MSNTSVTPLRGLILFDTVLCGYLRHPLFKYRPYDWVFRESGILGPCAADMPVFSCLFNFVGIFVKAVLWEWKNISQVTLPC